jgi:hypothetical protein
MKCLSGYALALSTTVFGLPIFSAERAKTAGSPIDRVKLSARK